MRELQVDCAEVEYSTRPLDPATVMQLVEKAGSVAALLNTRHAIAKERGWATKPPPPTEFAKAVAAEPNLIRRPILVHGNQVIIGFDRESYKLLK